MVSFNYLDKMLSSSCFFFLFGERRGSVSFNDLVCYITSSSQRDGTCRNYIGIGILFIYLLSWYRDSSAYSPELPHRVLSKHFMN